MQPLIFFFPPLFQQQKRQQGAEMLQDKSVPCWPGPTVIYIRAGMWGTHVSVLSMEFSLFGTEKTDWYIPGFLICSVVKVQPELPLHSLSSLLI